MTDARNENEGDKCPCQSNGQSNEKLIGIILLASKRSVL